MRGERPETAKLEENVVAAGTERVLPIELEALEKNPPCNDARPATNKEPEAFRLPETFNEKTELDALLIKPPVRVERP